MCPGHLLLVIKVCHLEYILSPVYCSRYEIVRKIYVVLVCVVLLLKDTTELESKNYNYFIHLLILKQHRSF